MRIAGFVVGIGVAVVVLATSDAALAASRDCGRGPPAWWNAPRVTYTYSGSSYAGGQSHSLSAQRRYQQPRRARMSYTPSRW